MMDDVATYARDGVVCLRGLLDACWIGRALAGLERQNANPGPLSQSFPARNGKGSFVSHLHGWRHDLDIRAVALESPLATSVATIMCEPELRLFYDQSFTKEAGANTPTPWHHDLTFWPVTGGPLASAWIALDPVNTESGAVHFLAGSHRDAARYRPTQPDSPNTMRMANMKLPLAPDGWAAPPDRLLAFDMAPGDVLIFDARTLHGARGNRNQHRPRRALTIRYASAQVRWATGIHALTFSPPITLEDGAPLDAPEFPLAYRR